MTSGNMAEAGAGIALEQAGEAVDVAVVGVTVRGTLRWELRRWDLLDTTLGAFPKGAALALK